MTSFQAAESSLPYPSKANTLAYLDGKLSGARLLPQQILTYDQWLQDAKLCLEEIRRHFSSPLAVRSSCQNEDTEHKSNAGQYLTLLNIPAETDSLKNAIEQVFTSYGEPKPADQVLLQPMLENVCCAGVAFNMDPNTGAPYFVFSADFSGNTDSVTSGAAGDIQSWYIRHHTVPEAAWQQQLIAIFAELNSIFPDQPLDIEFAFNGQQLYLLQVRPLVLSSSIISQTSAISSVDYQLELSCIEKKLQRLGQRHPYLLGDFTMFGVMPDWNPAEIIGTKPRPLALSLYKELVTDQIWATQRHNYGYRDVQDHPLLLVLGGTPFVDIRVSFNSFVPASLPEPLAEKLVNHYLRQLHQTPQLHDKVEFRIVLSCFSFDLSERLADLQQHGFTEHECQQIGQALIQLTDNIMADEQGVFAVDLARIDELSRRQHNIMHSDLNKIDKIYWLMQDCKRYGTLPFAGLARAGFIAIQLLNSLRDSGLLSSENYHAFMSGVRTVSSLMLADRQQLQPNDFIKKYGHLRPGTYDICSPRYDQDPAKYFSKEHDNKQQAAEFSLSLAQLNAINQQLKRFGLHCDAVAMFNFIKQAIEAREYSKFVFSRSLSDTLELIDALGKQLGFGRTELAYADIKDILRLQSTSHSANATLRSSITLGQHYFHMCQQIKLPALIRSATDASYYQLLADEPNYITNKTVTAPVCNSLSPDSLKQAIVFIEAADPGYDWLFSHQIAGLVTQYGGCNSHMAIRAQELGIPAIIGAGEWLFRNWQQARLLRIDCQSRKVDMIQ